MVIRTSPAVTFDPGDGPSRSPDWEPARWRHGGRPAIGPIRGPSRQSPSRSEPMSRSSDRTARITPRTHTHDLVREETTDLRVVARRRPESKSRVGRRHGPPVSTQRTSAKERDDANKTGHTDRPAG